MENSSNKYYLETNVLYSMINSIPKLKKTSDAATSLLAYQEIVWGISPEQYHKRKILLTKLKESGLKIYPYLPVECILISFGLDVSNVPLIIEEKRLLWGQVNLIISCENYEDYAYALKTQYDIDIDEASYKIQMREKSKQTILQDIIEKNHKEIKREKNERAESPQYHKINIEDLIFDPDKKPDLTVERELLIEALQICKFDFLDTEIDELLLNYDGKQLVAFILGRYSYTWNRSRTNRTPDINDPIDINHLLYLRDENHMIISDDRIFETAALRSMRMNCSDFRNAHLT
ncbi:hypothetical protein ASD24_10405 [Paenibacillus sp. Root52]|uniref:hypothetical protein n=1 Tax=Paenibacillus sp. Root52 TaxID=1736552 RepID=UPI0006F9C721|nr:hypothetical protein [Paenibacillus sp. Root52]KQY84183.1 hypothetical protein ASD24_10405 [Paenibacillus sp. Root52]